MGESAAVTGKARMEAAYGTGEGEGQGMAMVAQSVAPSAGTIFHQVYRPWRGNLNPRWVRNWSIFRHHVYGLFSKGHRPWPMTTKLVVVIVLFGSLLPIISMGIAALTGLDALMTQRPSSSTMRVGLTYSTRYLTSSVGWLQPSCSW